ncbi:MAG: ROK family protein [Eubacteriales bacterium]|nr:ROK family protein [Eubacteriales bacterium]
MLVLDIGGTFIKYALTDENGAILPATVRQVPSDAEGGYEDFLNVLAGILRQAHELQPVVKAGVSIPGPFDFDQGVSLMQHKFTALYDQSLRPPFEQAGVTVEFLHDSTAFMLGEAYDGVLNGANTAACVMLGTGLGFAYLRDGKVCVNDKRTPALALWKTPWRDGIAEDYVSTRAIQGLYGEKISVKSIADKARQGDQKALNAFQTTGRHLSEILNAILPKLGCERFAIGGQIAKSAELFELDVPVPWSVSCHLIDAALRGVGYYALHGRQKCELTLKDLLLNDSEGRI